MEFRKYLEIAENIGANEIVNQIKELEEKYYNKELNIVLVGEFTSGKTSLINSFFNINLPIDIKPKTATIWKIKRCEREKFVINFKNKEVKEVNSIEEVESFNPQDIALVEVCVKDIDENINFIDTPGLSSLDEFHREALENYIENADVVLVIADIAQGLVRTTKQFLEENTTNSQKLYIALTKADTKIKEDVKKQKEYIANNFKGFEKVIAVSRDDLSELKELLKEIEAKKEIILRDRIEEKLNHFCKMLRDIIDSMLEVDTSDINSLKAKKEEIELEISKIEKELSNKEKEFLNKIDNIAYTASNMLLNKLRANKNYIADALYDDNLDETINNRLQSVMQEAINEIATYVEKELQSNLNSLQNSLSSNFTIKDSTIDIIDIIVRFREVIIGGVLTLLSRLPGIGQIIAAADGIIEGLLESATRMLSRSYVGNKLEEAFGYIKKDVEKEIKRNLENNIDMLFEEFAKELKLRKQSFEESLDKLEAEIKDKEKDIQEYINSLKAYKKELNCKE